MATITVPAEKVIEAAKIVIADIKRHQAEQDERTIQRRMNSRHLGWRGFYYPTREQAIKLLDEANFFGWRSNRGWGDLEHAEKLLLLAKHGDPVVLNEEDARVLF